MRFPSTLWQSVALLAVPAITLVGLQIYDGATLLPDLARSQHRISHTFEVMDTARALDQSIQDAELSQRGFVITASSDYLEPYRAAVQETPVRLAQLKQLTSDNQEQQGGLRCWRSRSKPDSPSWKGGSKLVETEDLTQPVG